MKFYLYVKLNMFAIGVQLLCNQSLFSCCHPARHGQSGSFHQTLQKFQRVAVFQDWSIWLQECRLSDEKQVHENGSLQNVNIHLFLNYSGKKKLQGLRVSSRTLVDLSNNSITRGIMISLLRLAFVTLRYQKNNPVELKSWETHLAFLLWL